MKQETPSNAVSGAEASTRSFDLLDLGNQLFEHSEGRRGLHCSRRLQRLQCEGYLACAWTLLRRGVAYLLHSFNIRWPKDFARASACPSSFLITRRP